MKIALISDIHIGVRNDNLLFQEYFATFFIKHFFPYLKKNDIKTCIVCGDTLDRRKYVNFRTLDICNKFFINKLSENNIDTHIILGNHDVYWKNTNKINSVELLFKDKARIYTECQDVNFDGTNIAMIPWINQENEKDTFDFIKKSKSSVACAHLELRGFESSRGHIQIDGIDPDLFRHYQYVFSGHFHHKQSRGNIHYLGSPYEMIYSDVDDTRGFHIFDTETNDIKFIQNPERMFYSLMYDDSHEQTFNFSLYKNKYIKLVIINKQDILKFERFLDDMYDANPAHLSIIEDSVVSGLQQNENIGLLEDTVTILSKHIDSLNIKQDHDKDNLKKLMRELYIEANTREF